MVVFSSNGDLIVQRRNVDACQWLEYTAMLVTQYCKETSGRNKRLYDLRGVEICNMAGDLKEFVKGYFSRSGKRCNYSNNMSSSMILAIHDALDIFGDVYNSGSSKKYAQRLEEGFPVMFKYKRIVDLLIAKLQDHDFYLMRCDSASTSSVYLDIDYNNLPKIRVSDHYVEYEGIQIILSEERPEEAGKNGVYHILPEFSDDLVGKILDFAVQRLVNERYAQFKAQYNEKVLAMRSSYKADNPKYQEV